MKTVNRFSHKLRIFSLILVSLFLWKIASPQKISELPPATYMGTGDLMPIVQLGVTKKLPYAGLINSLKRFSDSIYVNYRCHSVKGQSKWYSIGDTIYIDPCSVSQLPPGSSDSCLFELHGDTIWNKAGYKVMLDDSVYFMRDAIRFMKAHEPLGGFLTLGKLDATGRRQLVMASFRSDSIEGIKIPLIITDTNYTSSQGSESVSFIDLSIHNDTLFLGLASSRLNDMIFVARTDYYNNSVVINSPSGIYYKSRSYWNMKLSKTMSGAILQSNGTDWYVIGVFFDQFSTPTMTLFSDSASFDAHVQFNSSIGCPNLDSAETAFQVFYDTFTGEFSYSATSSVQVIEEDPVYASDSASILHYADTTARIVTRKQLADSAAAIREDIPVSSNGYSITMGGPTPVFSDNVVWYAGIGNYASSPGYCRFYIPQSGTVKAVYAHVYSNTTGSNEAWPLALMINSTTAVPVDTVSETGNQYRHWENYSMNAPVSRGDYVTVRWSNPNWVTNPSTTNGYQVVVYIQ